MEQQLKYITEPAREVPVAAQADVIVVGGGPGGIGAALAAAGMGAKTILIERYNYLGGMSTGGMVTMFPHMSGGTKDIMPGGIMSEIIRRLDQVDGCIHPPIDKLGSDDPETVTYSSNRGSWMTSDEHRLRLTVHHDPELLKCVYNDMMEEAGVHLILHAWGTSALVKDNKVYGVCIESKSGRQAVLGKVVIDATGDGDLLPSAGAESDSKIDPHLRIRNFALAFHISGIDADRLEAFLKENPEALQRLSDEAFKAQCFTLMSSTPEALVTKARQNSVWVNNFIPGMGSPALSSSNVEHLTTVSIYAHAKMLRTLMFYRKHLPGFEKAFIRIAAPQLGIRGGRRLVGEYTLVEKDMADGTDFEDTIIAVPHLEHDISPEFPLRCIPYRCLVPKTVNGLLVAGRSFSSQDRVNEMLNLMPHCMGMGQAAGTAAALAVKHGVEVRDVDYKELRTSLRAQGVYLPLHPDEAEKTEKNKK